MMNTAVIIFAASWLCASAPTGAAVAVFEDPRSDDDGPGGYEYPTGDEYAPGDFDLRRLEVEVEGEDAIFTLTLGAELKRPAMVRRTHATELRLENGVYVQNIDIYLDRSPGGFTRALPGRNIRIESAGAWDTAVVITPQPFLTRAILERAMPEEAAHVYVAAGVRSLGRTIVARVPLDRLGGPPEAEWGYAVALSGAIWEDSFAAFGRLTKDFSENAFTMPVYAIAEGRAFGAGRLDRFQPHVVDIFVPPGQDQHRILAAFDAGAGQLAAIPMIYPVPKTSARPAAAGIAEKNAGETGEDISLRVSAVDEDRVVIAATPGPAPELWSIGQVLGERGEVVARVVITARFTEFLMATAVENKTLIRPGAVVRFAREKRRAP